MATPTQPLGLSAAAIAILQTRQTRPPQPEAAPAAAGAAPRQAPTNGSGRGRFIDLLA